MKRLIETIFGGVLTDCGGNVAITFALSAPMLIGGAAFMAETSYDFWRHNHLQAVADAAAYAAAIETRSGSSPSVVTSAAMDAATSNDWSPDGNSIQVNSPPTSGAHLSAQAVEVKLSENEPRFFSTLFSSDPLVTKARAVAIYQTAANACVLALNKTAHQAVQVQGNSRLALNGCDVVSNSVADDALIAWGSANLSAECAISSGGITNKNNITLTGCPAAITQAPRVADPFANLPTPSPGAAQSIPKNPKGAVTLSPGSYAGGMNLNGNVTLQPGVYYVSGGNFSVNANAVVSGSAVTIYLASGSNVSMNGNATVQMTAPTSGTYAGMLFFGDRNGGGSNIFNGDARSTLTGDIYFPSQQVAYQGSFSGNGGCTHIVADTVAWSGDASLAVDCSAQGMAAIPARQLVKIVE
jgi:Flp pilus assembly protein TadG